MSLNTRASHSGRDFGNILPNLPRTKAATSWVLSKLTAGSIAEGKPKVSATASQGQTSPAGPGGRTYGDLEHPRPAGVNEGRPENRRGPDGVEPLPVSRLASTPHPQFIGNNSKIYTSEHGRPHVDQSS